MDEEEFSKNWLDETLKINQQEELAAILYKYLSPKSEHFFSSLEGFILRNEIYLSGRKDFNDPFDCAIKLKNLSTDDNERYVYDLLSRNGAGPEFNTEKIRCQKTRQESLNDSLDQIGVYSMSSTIKSASMWAHYGSQHTGLALMISNAINEFGLIPVRYQPQREELDINHGHIEYQIYVKGREWAYEQEYRLAKPRKSNQWDIIPEHCPIGIVLGENFEIKTLEEVIRLNNLRVKNGLKKLEIFKAKVNSEKFTYDIFRLDEKSGTLIRIQGGAELFI